MTTGRGSVDGMRPSSSSYLLQRLQHPQTPLAFARRVVAAQRGVILNPSATQHLRKPNACDFDRLSQPRDTKLTPEELSAMKKEFAAVTQPGRRPSSSVERSVPSTTCDMSDTSRPSSSLSRVATPSKEQQFPPRPASVIQMRRSREARRRIAVEWPPSSAREKSEAIKARLNPFHISATLRRAVFGQSLDSVLRQRSETPEVRLNDTSGSSPKVRQPEDGALTAEESMELHVTLEGFDPHDGHQSMASRRNKNNNIFVAAAQDASSDRHGGLEENYALLTFTGQQNDATHRDEDESAVLMRLADPVHRRNLTSIGHREYTLIRKLFCELDDKHEGSVSLAQVLEFHKKYPRRLGRDILDNLRVELDGRIFLDELIRVHFPALPSESIEQLIELFEPRVQSVDSVRPETRRLLESLYVSITERFEHVTFASWLREQRHVGSSGAAEHDPLASSFASSVATGSHRHIEDDRSSQTSHSEQHLTGRSTRRASLTSANSCITARAASQAQLPVAVMNAMNAMQLLLHFQQSTSGAFSVLDLLQLYRLKHLVLRPSYTVALMRALRKAAASARFAGSGRAAVGSTNQYAGFVVEPQTGALISERSLQQPVIPSSTEGGSSSSPALEPSIPFLTNCQVKFSDFVVMMMDYYVMAQNGVSVEPFDPHLKAFLDSQTWEKLFPHTGPVKDYFIT